jgi:hypothetical protein
VFRGCRAFAEKGSIESLYHYQHYIVHSIETRDLSLSQRSNGGFCLDLNLFWKPWILIYLFPYSSCPNFQSVLVLLLFNHQMLVWCSPKVFTSFKHLKNQFIIVQTSLLLKPSFYQVALGFEIWFGNFSLQHFQSMILASVFKSAIWVIWIIFYFKFSECSNYKLMEVRN